MQIQIVKSKIHRAKVTEANIDYKGSITIDEALMEAGNLIENEQVHVLNYRNGERIVTYVIKGKRNSGIICINGPASMKFSVGDEVIIISYCTMDFEEGKKFKPNFVYPDKKNNLTK